MKVEKFLNKIKKEFPKLKWSNFEYIKSGFDHNIIILDQKIIFRFPKYIKYKNNLKNEILLLKYLKNKVKISIPNYTYIAQDFSFAGYKLLNGEELNVNVFKKISSTDKKIIIKELAEFLTKLHLLDNKKIKIEEKNNVKIFSKLIIDTKKYIFPRLNKKEIKIIENFFEELKLSLNHKISKSIIHNDLTSDNLLWNKSGKVLNIIDFSDFCYNDSAYDFSGLWEYGEKFVKQVYKLYQGKKDNEFLKRSKLYYKIIPLEIMKMSVTGKVCNFKDGYKLFEERFI